MDVQKTIEFMLENGARLDARLERVSAEIEALKAIVLHHDRDLQSHDLALQAHTEWKLAMSQALQDLAAQMKHGFDLVAKKHSELAEKQKTTEENLNILIRTVQEIIPRLPRQ